MTSVGLKTENKPKQELTLLCPLTEPQPHRRGNSAGVISTALKIPFPGSAWQESRVSGAAGAPGAHPGYLSGQAGLGLLQGQGQGPIVLHGQQGPRSSSLLLLCSCPGQQEKRIPGKPGRDLVFGQTSMLPDLPCKH